MKKSILVGVALFVLTVISPVVARKDFLAGRVVEAAANPSITVTAPLAGYLSKGKHVQVSWNTEGLSPSQKMDITLNVGETGTGKVIAKSVPNTGSYDWTVKGLQPFYASEAHTTIRPTGQYQIYVSCHFGDVGCDFSPNFGASQIFNIVSGNVTQPLITSISPKSGKPGTKVFIHGKGFFGLNLVNFGERSVTPTKVSPQGSLITFVVPDQNPSITDVPVSVVEKFATDLEPDGGVGSNSVFFKLTASNASITSATPSAIQVISPRTGATYHIASNGMFTIPFLWTANHPLGVTYVYLLNSTAYNIPAVASVRQVSTVKRGQGHLTQLNIVDRVEGQSLAPGQYWLKVCDDSSVTDPACGISGAFTLVGTSQVQSCPFEKNLTRSSVGPSVVYLKDFLKEQGFLVSDKEFLGKYDQETFLAVKAFQTANGIIASGLVDASTRAKMNTLCVPSGHSISSNTSSSAINQVASIFEALKHFLGF